MMIRTLIAAALPAGAAGSPLSAAILYSNGPATGNAGYCGSNVGSCGSNGWAIYSPFTIASASTVTGASYGAYNAGSYTSTNWSI